MALTNAQLAQEISTSKIDKYEMVRLAIEWIAVKKQEEDYRKLTQPELISKALDDVVKGIATQEAIDDIKKKIKAKENKESEKTAEQV